MTVTIRIPSRTGIPVDFDSLADSGILRILHSRRDSLPAVQMDAYYVSYRLIAFYLAYPDDKLAPKDTLRAPCFPPALRYGCAKPLKLKIAHLKTLRFARLALHAQMHQAGSSTLLGVIPNAHTNPKVYSCR